MPLRGVELDALEAERLGVLAQLVEAGLAVAGVEVVVVGQLVRVLGQASANASSVWPKPL